MLISVLTPEGFPMNFGIKTNIIAKKSLHMYPFPSFINCSHPSPTYTDQVLPPFSRVSLFHRGANSLFFIPLSSCNPQILLLVFRPQLSPLQSSSLTTLHHITLIYCLCNTYQNLFIPFNIRTTKTETCLPFSLLYFVQMVYS